MKKKAIAMLAAVLITFTVQAQENYIPGELIVLIKQDQSVEQWCQQLSEDIQSNVTAKQRLANSINLWVVAFDSSLPAEAVLIKAERLTTTKIAQLNHSNLVVRNDPNDALFGNQWALYNDGTNGGGGSADIDAKGAWDISTGGLTAKGDTIVVAVIDGGFKLDHPDLAPNYYVNHGEIEGNFVDDDGNGYIDDKNGWNAYNSSGTIWSDNHGTHVAGIIGARGNNGFGVTGVNWNVKVLPICGSSSQESTVIGAYGYVLDQRKLYNQTNGAEGAYIVSTNSSFGVNYGDPANYPLWCAMYDSMGIAGVLSAGATANLNIDIDVQGDIPTACASNFLISVTNTTSYDVKSSGAAYGTTTIDLGAPGSSIYSTTLSGYGNLSGTSMATPHVAGAVALMYSAMCEDLIDAYGASPGALAAFVRNQLFLHGVDQLSSMSAYVATSGRLNLHKAVKSVADSCLQLNLDIVHSNCGMCDGNITVNVIGGTAPYTYSWSNGGTTAQVNNLCSGSYSVTVVDDEGTSSVATASISDLGGPTVNVLTTDITCPGGMDGTAILTGADHYVWPDSSTASVRNLLSAGTYSVTATNDGDSCASVVTVVLTEPASMVVTSQSVLPVPYTGSNGTLQISVTGGTSPYAYSWSTGDTSTSLIGLSVGTYTVTITDAEGCTHIEDVLLGFPEGINSEVSKAAKIYPNPARDFLIVALNSPEVATIQVSSITGQLVFQTQTETSGRKQIDTDNLSPGTYLISIRGEQTAHQELFQVAR